MTDPITPPPKLVREWMERTQYDEHTWFYESYIAEQAARWGADQELEACCEYLTHCAAWEPEDVKEFCDLRRPKPPSLKEQALKELAWVDKHLKMPLLNQCDAITTIRRALESLPD